MINTFPKIPFPAAEVETTMKRLLSEIESTKRCVNAREFRVIQEPRGNLQHSIQCGSKKWNETKRSPQEDQGED